MTPRVSHPRKSAALLRKGAISAAFMAAISGPLAMQTLVTWEGDIHKVYADNLAGGLPTFCAGRTDWQAKVGTKLTSDYCEEVNKFTLIEYGYAVLECAEWEHLTPKRLTALTIFAVNVGKKGACGSQAMQQINIGNVTLGCNLIAYGYDGAPNWSYAGGKYVNGKYQKGKFVDGLFSRRKAERALCLG